VLTDNGFQKCSRAHAVIPTSEPCLFFNVVLSEGTMIKKTVRFLFFSFWNAVFIPVSIYYRVWIIFNSLLSWLFKVPNSSLQRLCKFVHSFNCSVKWDISVFQYFFILIWYFLPLPTTRHFWDGRNFSIIDCQECWISELQRLFRL